MHRPISWWANRSLHQLFQGPRHEHTHPTLHPGDHAAAGADSAHPGRHLTGAGACTRGGPGRYDRTIVYVRQVPAVG